jgi:hypothetical protein
MRWNKRAFDAQGLTQFPPGVHLDALRPKLKIRVTTVGTWDNIGEVIRGMGVEYELFGGEFDCSLLFANCGTPDSIDPARAREFVEGGGCLYASDLQASLVLGAFPELCSNGGSISSGGVRARVEDPELVDIIGSDVDISFDTSGRVVESDVGFTILRHPSTGQSIMIEIPAGDGAIFFTSFHNHTQASREEKELLQMLVLKQIGRTTKSSVMAAGRALGLGLVKR